MAGNWYAQYPPSVSSNPSVGPNGAVAPTSSTEVGGVGPDGNLHPISTDNSGHINVNIVGTSPTPLPVTDAAAEASLASIDTKTPTQGQKTMAASSPVVIASDQSTLPVSAASLPLPTGASTAALQSNVQSAPGTPQTVALTIQGNAASVAVPVSVSSLPLPTGAATAALQSNVQSAAGTSATTLITVQGSVTGVAQPISAATLPLPTGAATAANQTNASQKTQIVDGSGNVIASTSNALNVDVINFPATQPVSGSVTANQGTANTIASAWPVKPTDGTNSQAYTAAGEAKVSVTSPLGQQAAAASISVALANEDVQDLYVIGQAAQTATVNNILTTTAGTAATDLISYRSFAVQIVSTGTAGTYIFEGSNDNVSFQTIPVFNQLILTGTPIVSAITATASQIIYQGAAEFRYLRLRIATTITGGSIQAFSAFSMEVFSPSVTQVAQATAANLNVNASGTVTSNQGTAAVVANSWYTKLSDGTTGPVKVQPASTAPAATDIALTVAISPNSSLVTTAPSSATATLSNVAASITSVTLLASNTLRKNATIFNDSTSNLYVKFGATASTTSFTVLLVPNAYYELPNGAVYNGILTGIWVSAVGNARVMELT